MARGKKTGGRKKGSLNRMNQDLRQDIGDFLRDNFEAVKTEWQKLEGKDKLTFYKDLLRYAVPQLQNTSLQTDLSKLTDEQLDYIVGNLLEQIEND